jgi:general secretion pathway protein M
MMAPAMFSLGVTALLLVLLVALVAGALLPRAQSAAGELSAIEPRHARLLGLREHADRVLEAEQQLQQVLRAHAYSATMPADRVGADLQQRLRSDAAESGFAVAGSQIQPVRTLEGFDVVPVSLLMEGSVEHLSALSERLGEMRPAVRVVSLNISPLRGRNVSATRNLRVELVVAAARLTQ